MLRRKIAISTLEEAKAFVNMASEYMNLDIMLESNSYKIDGHSIMGVISIDMHQPIICEVEGDITDSFLADIEKFAIK